MAHVIEEQRTLNDKTKNTFNKSMSLQTLNTEHNMDEQKHCVLSTELRVPQTMCSTSVPETLDRLLLNILISMPTTEGSVFRMANHLIYN